MQYSLVGYMLNVHSYLEQIFNFGQSQLSFAEGLDIGPVQSRVVSSCCLPVFGIFQCQENRELLGCLQVNTGGRYWVGYPAYLSPRKIRKTCRSNTTWIQVKWKLLPNHGELERCDKKRRTSRLSLKPWNTQLKAGIAKHYHNRIYI